MPHIKNMTADLTVSFPFFSHIVVSSSSFASYILPTISPFVAVTRGYGDTESSMSGSWMEMIPNTSFIVYNEYFLVCVLR